MQKDVLVLRRALEKHHPGLYWYASQHDFKLTWDSLDASINTALSEGKFLQLLLPVIAKVQCAHTLFYPSEYIRSSGTRFPLDLKFIDGTGYIVSGPLNQYSIPVGSEISEINDKPLGEIVAKILPSIQAQGGNLGWKYVVLENDFQNYYYYIIGHADTFQIEYIDRVTGATEMKTVNGSTEERLRTHWKNWYPNEDGPPLNMKIVTQHNVAIITVKSLSRGRYKLYQQDRDKILDQYFETIQSKAIEKLIIDVRGNEGGNDPEQLYSYIARQNERSTDRPGGRNEIIHPKESAFQGDVIVIANQKTISAQETFVSIFKENDRGMTIGRPTAGCFKGLCGGKKHRLKLPNSRHEIRIPMYASFRTYSQEVNYREGEGLPPDLIVEEKIEDILADKDTALELALNIIEHGL